MNWIPVGRVEDLPVEGGLKVERGDVAVAVFRVGDAVYALADRCSHAEASLSEGEVFDTEVECPRHGAVFDITDGRPLTLPATVPVAVYPVRVDDGEVYVDLEAS